MIIKREYEGEESLEALVIRQCDGGDYETGALEEAQRTARLTSAMLGRLIDQLAEAGDLRAHQVKNILGLYGEITMQSEEEREEAR